MSPEKHKLLQTMPPAVVVAVHSAAQAARVGLDHLVDHVLGRRVFGLYPPGKLDAAVAPLDPAVLVEVKKLGDRWPANPPPPWYVMTAGRGGPKVTDLDATTAVLARHFDGNALPIRIQLREHAWIIARHAGTLDDVRDVPPSAALLAELDAGLVYPPEAGPPPPVEGITHGAIPAAWQHKIDAAGDAAHAAAKAAGGSPEAATAAGHAAADAVLADLMARAARAMAAMPSQVPPGPRVDWAAKALDRFAANRAPDTPRVTSPAAS